MCVWWWWGGGGILQHLTKPEMDFLHMITGISLATSAPPLLSALHGGRRQRRKHPLPAEPGPLPSFPCSLCLSLSLSVCLSLSLSLLSLSPAFLPYLPTVDFVPSPVSRRLFVSHVEQVRFAVGAARARKVLNTLGASRLLDGYRVHVSDRSGAEGRGAVGAGGRRPASKSNADLLRSLLVALGAQVKTASVATGYTPASPMSLLP